MASVISSSPRADGAMASAAAKMCWSKQYTPTSARSLGGCFGFSTSRRTRGSPDISPFVALAALPDSSSATPNSPGFSTGVSRMRQLSAQSGVPKVRTIGASGSPIRLSPRNMMKRSSPRNARAVSTACAPARAVAHRGADLLVGVADDDAHLTDAGLQQRFDGVEEHGLVRQRQQLLGARVGERAQARAFAAAQDQSFHTAAHAAAFP